MQEAPKEKVKSKAKGISLRFLLVGLIFLLALLIFGYLADEMVLEKEHGFDNMVFLKIAGITSHTMTVIMLFITFFGSTYFLFPAYILLILYFLVYKKNRKLSLDVAAIGITSTAILFSMKYLFHRPRPLDPLVRKVNGFSFPSGHSFSSFTFLGLLIFIIWNHEMNPILRWILTLFFFFFACAIAFSRVYLHVHYASDVIAGFCICLIWLGMSLWVLKKIDKKTAL